MYIFLFFIIILFTGCSFDNVVTNEGLYDNQGELRDYNSSFQADKISVSYAIKDGNLVWIKKSSPKSLEFLESIEDVVDVYCDRFAFLKNGDVVDLYGRTPEEIIQEVIDPEVPNYDSLKEVTLSTVENLYQNIGIKKFYDPPVVSYVIRANDGNVYYLDLRANLADTVEVQKDILSEDGKIYNAKFPETYLWENVVDYSSCEDFIIGLTSEGLVLSSGIEFWVENAVKINTIYFNSQRIPVALTADGKLVFGDDYPQYVETAIKEAESFSDVCDFTWVIKGDDLVILVQKSDGTLWATTNDIYNPEYVNQYSE